MGWSAPRSAAPSATATWATSSTTGRATRAACATASTRCRSSWSRTRADQLGEAVGADVPAGDDHADPLAGDTAGQHRRQPAHTARLGDELEPVEAEAH